MHEAMRLRHESMRQGGGGGTCSEAACSAAAPSEPAATAAASAASAAAAAASSFLRSSRNTAKAFASVSPSRAAAACNAIHQGFQWGP
jgi:hypothetical protein